MITVEGKICDLEVKQRRHETYERKIHRLGACTQDLNDVSKRTSRLREQRQ